MRIRYQAYAWDGKEYRVISVPKYKTNTEAVQAAEAIIKDKDNDSIMNSIRKHYKEKPIIAKEHRF